VAMHAYIDVGGLGPVDPALDLVGTCSRPPHDTPCGSTSPAVTSNGRAGPAWALQQALGAGWYYTDTNAATSSMGQRALQRLLAQPPSIP
jgi:hypothetical protein